MPHAARRTREREAAARGSDAACVLVSGTVHQRHQRARHRRTGGTFGYEATNDLRTGVPAAERRQDEDEKQRDGGADDAHPAERDESGHEGPLRAGCRLFWEEYQGAGARESHQEPTTILALLQCQFNAPACLRPSGPEVGGLDRGSGRLGRSAELSGASPALASVPCSTPCCLLPAGMTCRPAFTTLDASRRGMVA